MTTSTAVLPDRRGPGQQQGGQSVLVQALTINTQVVALLGSETGAKITGGYGNWQAVAVPRGAPVTQWTGRNLYTQDVDLLLDGWATNRSVEAQCAAVETMATRPASLDTPPPVRMFGPVPHANLQWVITGIDWGDALRRPDTGERVRQPLTLHLLEYREETTLEALPRASAAARPPRKYKVKHGDNLKKIATRLLGKSSKWPQIAKANPPLRGWKLPAKYVGKTIKVPPK